MFMYTKTPYFLKLLFNNKEKESNEFLGQTSISSSWLKRILRAEPFFFLVTAGIFTPQRPLQMIAIFTIKGITCPRIGITSAQLVEEYSPIVGLQINMNKVGISRYKLKLISIPSMSLIIL